MIYRILIFVLLLSACTSNGSTEANGSDDTSTEAVTTTPDPEQSQPKTEGQLVGSVLTSLTKATELTAEQQSEIVTLINQVGPENLSQPGEVRSKLRRKILNEVLTPEQANAWSEYQRKRNRAPVVIE